MPNGPPVVRDMPRTRYAGLFEPEQIPRARPERLRQMDVTGYRAASTPKAAALHTRGNLFIVVGHDSQYDAEELALSQCNNDPVRKGAGGPCFLYAVGDRVVLPQRSVKPLTPSSFHDGLVARLVSLSVIADEVEARTRLYEADPGHKAIAVAVKAHRTWRFQRRPSEETAIVETLEGCQIYYGEPCTLAAADNKVEPAADGSPALRDMPRTHYSGLFELDQIPLASESLLRRPDVVSYRSSSNPKAAAYHPWGRMFIVVGGDGQFEAEELALGRCNSDPDRRGRDGLCFLYAVGDQVVLPQRSYKPLTEGTSANK